jgi:N-acyl-phosphatidylethanolamine-hydrolysing phospholipase D
VTAPHHTEHGFRNPWPDSEPRGLRDVIRWSWQRRRQNLAPNPAPGSIPQAQPLFAAHANDRSVSVTWVGHATVLLQLGRINVLTDPMWSERASPVSFAGPRRLVAAAVDFEKLPPIDVVLISHNHYDHLDRPTVRALARRMPDIEWLAPLGLGQTLRRWGAARVREMDWEQNTRVATSNGELYAACLPAQHFSARGLGDRGRTLWCSWVVSDRDTRVFFSGDTAYHPEFASIGERYGPFTMLMLPIGAYEPRWFMRTVHMNPPEALRAYAQLSGATGTPPILLPIHWGTFRLTDESMQEPPEWTARLWREAGYDATKLWLLQHGETRNSGTL